ncbi:MAG: murein L,D-transpeptidase family protein [Candidatus Binatia bacterium]
MTKRIFGGPRARAVVGVLLVVAMTAFIAAACAPRQKSQRLRRAAPRPPAPSYAPYIPWGEHSDGTRLAEIGPTARRRWQGDFQRAAVTYPPASVTFVAFKREKKLDVYAGASPYRMSLIRSIPVTAASGGPGPKLREGDRQVPEGVYQVEALNPNSLYHVSLRLAYPNEFDRRMAAGDRRRKLGSDIMIHGSDRSIGCLAVGDQAAEDLFVIAADAGIENVSVLIAPRDFRRTGEAEPLPGQPAWVRGLYAELELRLRNLANMETLAAEQRAGRNETFTAHRQGAPLTTIDPAHGR